MIEILLIDGATGKLYQAKAIHTFLKPEIIIYECSQNYATLPSISLYDCNAIHASSLSIHGWRA